MSYIKPIIYGVALATSIGGAVLVNQPTTVVYDMQPIITRVQHVKQIADKHEARINNLEKDIKNMEDTTKPVVNKVVPVVEPVSPKPEVEPTVDPPAPVVPVHVEPPVPSAPTENNNKLEHEFITN